MLMPHQITAVEHGLNKPWHGILDVQGLGKTLSALSIFVRSKRKRCLIVCPAYLKYTWLGEIKKFYPEEGLAWAIEGTSKQINLDNIKFIVVSYDVLSKIEYIAKECDHYIFDEFHYCKSPDTKRFQAVDILTAKYKPEGLTVLTGTPITNRVKDCWSILYVLSKGTYQRSYWNFCNYFSHATKKRIGRREITEFKGLKNYDQLRTELKQFCIRRNLDSVKLPTLTQKKVIVSYNGDKNLSDAWSAFTEGRPDTTSSGKATSAKMKAEFTGKYIIDLLEQETAPLLVFSDHKEPLYIMQRMLEGGYAVALITGEVTTQKRDEIIREFQAGKIQVLLATIPALCTGVTLTKATNVIYNDVSWIPANNSQSMARIYRIGQKEPCFAHIIIGSKEDEAIFDKLAEKKEAINTVNKGIENG